MCKWKSAEEKRRESGGGLVAMSDRDGGLPTPQGGQRGALVVTHPYSARSEERSAEMA